MSDIVVLSRLIVTYTITLNNTIYNKKKYFNIYSAKFIFINEIWQKLYMYNVILMQLQFLNLIKLRTFG